jgi:hypothetical protein
MGWPRTVCERHTVAATKLLREAEAHEPSAKAVGDEQHG